MVQKLPAHLQRMVLFTVNTGARDDNVCGLRWDWEVPVPELGRSVFVIPAEQYKGKRPHVLILNDVAWRSSSRAAACTRTGCCLPRGRVKNIDKEPVMQYDRIDTMNNTGWQNARRAAGLDAMRMHDLRHNSETRIIPRTAPVVFSMWRR